LVLPSAFHSNEGAAGIRRLLLHQMRLHSCYSFENRRKLFEIHSSFKFAPIVAEAGGATTEFHCRFYLHDDEWLFSPQREAEQLTYTRQFVQTVSGASLNFPELRRPEDVEPFLVAYRSKIMSFEQLRSSCNVHPTEELHKGKQKWRFVRAIDVIPSDQDARDPIIFSQILERGFLPLIEGKTFHQYTDRWSTPPEFLCPLDRLTDKAERIGQTRTYRLVFRKVASSTNERTGIFTILPPGGVCTDSALVESRAMHRNTCDSLLVCGLANSFVFDWLLRQFVAANVQFGFLNQLPVPNLSNVKNCISHCVVRLICNHSGYESLWREQLGEEWREEGTAITWPALSGEPARWAVRAAIDAVVAQAYGLSRDQYVHVLSSFSHSSFREAPQLCLAAFDELQRDGVDAFTRRHDPYWDIPLNESLPHPVIDLPIPAAAPGEAPRPRTGELFEFETTAAPPGSGRLFAEQPVPPTRRRGRRT